MNDEKIEFTEPTDGEVFVPTPPDDTDVGIWVAKPLSLRNTTLLIRMFAGVLARATLRAADLFTEDSITEEGVMELLLLLDDNLLRGLLAIITGSDKGTVEETFVLAKAVRVIIDFWTQEELGTILGEAKRLAPNQEFNERNVG